MNKALPAALIAVTLPLLASCGSIVGAAIPAQTVDNPANLNSATLSSDGPFTAQAVATTIKYDTSTMVPSGSFDDLSLPNLPLNLKPYMIEIATLGSEITLTGTCEMPNQVNVTLSNFSVSAWNQSDPSQAVTVVNPTATTWYATGGTPTAGSRTYTVAAVQIKTTFKNEDAVKLLTILTTGGKNDVKVSGSISSSLDSLAGCTVSLKLSGAKATLSNFK